MKTELGSATDSFDAVVIGGGVYGILLALEGASLGQRVLLVERDDFGGGATFNHLRTIHGGLRYLQFLDFRRAIASNRQRLWWLKTFPDLIHPISCLMPLYGQGARRPEAFYGAFMMARALGLNKDGEGKARRMQVISTSEVKSLLPHSRTEGLNKGALWQDAFMPYPHRVIAELLHWAEDAGAVLRNRTEFLSATPEERGGWRVKLKDHRSGAQFEVASRFMINATASATDEVARRMTGARPAPVLVPTLAWGMLIDRPPVSECSVAVAPPGKGRRTYFVHPYHGRVLAGTGHAGIPAGAPLPSGVTDEQVQATLDDLNEAMPGVEFRMGDVNHVFWGILPGVEAGSEALLMHPKVVDHGAQDRAPGAWTVLGVKFTEAPFLAHRLWNTLVGEQAHVLPPRPKAFLAPDTESACRLSDDELSAQLRELARSEWRAGADDLIWRRTDLWMDPAQANRVRVLDVQDQGSSVA
jgi:glycerol-3-phosphate dehydrogenase